MRSSLIRSLRGPRIMTGRVYCIVSCWTASYDSTFSSLPAISSISILAFLAAAGLVVESFCYPRLECLHSFKQLGETNVSLSMRRGNKKKLFRKKTTRLYSNERELRTVDLETRFSISRKISFRNGRMYVYVFLHTDCGIARLKVARKRELLCCCPPRTRNDPCFST